ncbi:family 20 glycosylhydrolase [Glaciecola petra]|uniref:beta-N-acetylhexosaminidase n=1 Tax=Glaciecola petra TaxID=3075602 RepID=A0ABU2ZT35_9ALTE|nr:family 20 glycosylhydrolase [Aestuariibacter sp. P117]MDT0595798.1 family 20 glycosylhydrolase [Aestuariibacter sp. P117]
MKGRIQHCYFLFFIFIKAMALLGLLGGICVKAYSNSEKGDARIELLEAAANNIQIKISVQHNYLDSGCPNSAASCYQATLYLKLATQMPKQWRILFSHLSPINKVQSENFTIRHINGDLHEIRPINNSAEQAYDPLKEYQISFFGFTPLVSESILFPNYLLVSNDSHARVIASTLSQQMPGQQIPKHQHVLPFTLNEQLKRGANDAVAIATATERLERFSSRSALSLNDKPPNSPRIIPNVKHSAWTHIRLDIKEGIALPDTIKQNASLYHAITQRLSNNGITLNDKGIKVQLVGKPKGSHEPDMKDANLQINHAQSEVYHLSITDNSIIVKFTDNAGLYYAFMSLAQLYSKDSQSLPIGTINDSPSLGFRGLHIDVSRNFRSKAFILQTIDQMSYFKLNKLHLHLADDEGWRLQIMSLPELTEIGGYRCFDERETQCLLPQLAGGDGVSQDTVQNSGFYTVDDYQAILKYAHARQVEIIPSFDMPGHSRAAIVSMRARYYRLMQENKPEQATQFLLTEFEDQSRYRSIQHYNDNTLNPCLPSTYRFIEEVLNNLIAIHHTAGVPLKRYHLGADETAGAWQNSPACARFIAKHKNMSEVSELGPYFIERVTNIVSNLGITPAAWSDGLSSTNPHNLPSNIQANAWETLYSGGHSKAHEKLNRGWQVVLSTPDVLYFDFPYEADPIEPGYYWGSRYTDTYQVFQFMPFNLPAHAELWSDNFERPYSANAKVTKKRDITGIQGQLWGETVRTDAQANYMLYPRLLALAERAWHTPTWAEKYQGDKDYSVNTNQIDKDQKTAIASDWKAFTQLLTTKTLAQLVRDGVIPRVPLPGANMQNNTLIMQSAFTGLILEYRLEDSDWQRYDKPVPVDHAHGIEIRARIGSTNISSRIQKLQ